MITGAAGRRGRLHPAVADVRVAVRRGLADLPAGALVLAACSGGADSLALAAALAHEAPRAGLRAGAVTVDHGLQDGSAERADAVAKVLDGLGLEPVLVRRVAVTGTGGPEGAARAARYRALDDVAAGTGAVAVLLAHTRDDQAETVLLRLARGSGARSLAGMAPVTGRYRRPLLDLPRDRVREACLASGLDPWDDPHNLDPAYARSRVRHDLLPALVDALGPGVLPGLARTAALLRADADALDEWAGRAYAGCRDDDGALAVAPLAGLPEAVRARVLRGAALAAGCPGGSLGAGHVRAIDELVTGWHGQDGVDLPGAVSCVRRHDRLLFEPRERKGADGRE